MESIIVAALALVGTLAGTYFANLPDSAIKTIVGWESLEMVGLYKDIDDEEEIGKYFADGEIVGQKQAGLSDL